jgi:hypothetical protein
LILHVDWSGEGRRSSISIRIFFVWYLARMLIQSPAGNASQRETLLVEGLSDRPRLLSAWSGNQQASLTEP